MVTERQFHDLWREYDRVNDDNKRLREEVKRLRAEVRRANEQIALFNAAVGGLDEGPARRLAEAAEAVLYIYENGALEPNDEESQERLAAHMALRDALADPAIATLRRGA